MLKGDSCWGNFKVARDRNSTRKNYKKWHSDESPFNRKYFSKRLFKLFAHLSSDTKRFFLQNSLSARLLYCEKKAASRTTRERDTGEFEILIIDFHENAIESEFMESFLPTLATVRSFVA